jgi:hypothetical protein
MKTKMAPSCVQRGFATTEYCVVCGLVMMGLFAGNPSLAAQLVNAVKNFYRALTFFISLP